MDAAGYDWKMTCLVCVHGLFRGVEYTELYVMVFDTGLWHVGRRMYGFGVTYALLYLFHVTLLFFVGFRKVFCHLSAVSPWNMVRLPLWISASNVVLVGKLSMAWRYQTMCVVEGRL